MFSVFVPAESSLKKATVTDLGDAAGELRSGSTS